MYNGQSKTVKEHFCCKYLRDKRIKVPFFFTRNFRKYILRKTGCKTGCAILSSDTAAKQQWVQQQFPRVRNTNDVLGVCIYKPDPTQTSLSSKQTLAEIVEVVSEENVLPGTAQKMIHTQVERRGSISGSSVTPLESRFTRLYSYQEFILERSIVVLVLACFVTVALSSRLLKQDVFCAGFVRV